MQLVSSEMNQYLTSMLELDINRQNSPRKTKSKNARTNEMILNYMQTTTTCSSLVYVLSRRQATCVSSNPCQCAEILFCIAMHFDVKRKPIYKWKLLRRIWFELLRIRGVFQFQSGMEWHFAFLFILCIALHTFFVFRVSLRLIYVCGKRRRHTLDIRHRATIIHIILNKTRIDNHLPLTDWKVFVSVSLSLAPHYVSLVRPHCLWSIFHLNHFNSS